MVTPIFGEFFCEIKTQYPASNLKAAANQKKNHELTPGVGTGGNNKM